MIYAQAVAIATVVALAAFFINSLRSSKSKPFPPGPPTTPLLGNLTQLPTKLPFLQFQEWGSKYAKECNGLVGLRLGPYAKMMIINNHRDISELIDTNGSTYADRSTLVIADYMKKWASKQFPFSYIFVFSNYNEEVRRARRAGRAYLLRSDRIDKVLRIQEAESTQALYELLHQKPGESHNPLIMRMFVAIIMASIYGIRGRDWKSNEYIRNFGKMMKDFSDLSDITKSPPTDIFPFVQYLPKYLSPWRGWLDRTEEFVVRWQKYWYNFTKAVGENEDSVLKKLQDQGFPEDELITFGASMISGGAETTTSTCLTVLAALAKYPEFQARAYEEVNSLCGEDKMPTGENLPDLAFVRACFYEALRWRPLIPIGPRGVREDHMYNGFFIEKGTRVIVNIWGLSHDPEKFERPDDFVPTRYEPQLQKNFDKEKVKPLPIYAFGSGLRMCPGQKLAENGVSLAVAKILWAFEIIADGEIDLDVETGYNDSFLLLIKEKKLRFRPRSDLKTEIIKREWIEADEWLSRFEA